MTSNKSMCVSYSEIKYSLRLANGHIWDFLATRGAELWLNRLATTMGLRSCATKGTSKIILAVEEVRKDKREELTYIPDIPLMKSTESRVKYRFHDYHEMTEIIYYVNQNETHENIMFRMWNLTFFIGRREQLFGGLVCHAGLVEKNGNCVLLAGSGGIGKSTCCRRIPPPWRARADDLVFVVPDERGQYKVHPMPTWSEFLRGSDRKVWNVEDSYSLSAIFFLQQGKEDEVVPLQPWQATSHIYRSAMEGSLIGYTGMDKAEIRVYREGLFNNACNIAGLIPTYTLKVSLNGTFWKEIEKVA